MFRTYNASFTLQQQLDELTDPSDNVAAKMLSYNRANREVAILCNHQKAVSKNHEDQMKKLQDDLSERQHKLKLLEQMRKFLKAGKQNDMKGELKKFANEKGAPKTVDAC